MTVWDVAEYAGLAVAYAALATALGLGLARVAGLERVWHLVPFVFLTLVFVVLTQHPVPDPASLDCPLRSATPQLRPFNFMGTVFRLAESEAGPLKWLTNRTLAATGMNLMLCVAIGAALARHIRALWGAAVFGATLSLTVELTQLTGTWGLFPCAYRQFNVDDLILNVTGIVLGFAVGRLVQTRARPGAARLRRRNG